MTWEKTAPTTDCTALVFSSSQRSSLPHLLFPLLFLTFHVFLVLLHFLKINKNSTVFKTTCLSGPQWIIHGRRFLLIKAVELLYVGAQADEEGQCVWPDQDGGEIDAICLSRWVQIRITLRWVYICACCPRVDHKRIRMCRCNTWHDLNSCGFHLSDMSQQPLTLSERVNGVAGRQIGAGDKVLTRRRLYLHSRPAL